MVTPEARIPCTARGTVTLDLPRLRATNVATKDCRRVIAMRDGGRIYEVRRTAVPLVRRPETL